MFDVVPGALATAHAPMSCSRATYSHVPRQADRRDRIAGRVDVGNALLQQGALSPALHLCVRIHQPTEHGPFQHLAPWPSVVVPALSPTTLCVHMLVGLPAASATMGCVMEDDETVAGGASAAAIALEMVLVRARPYGVKISLSCSWVCACQYTL